MTKHCEKTEEQLTLIALNQSRNAEKSMKLHNSFMDEWRKKIDEANKKIDEVGADAKEAATNSKMALAILTKNKKEKDADNKRFEANNTKLQVKTAKLEAELKAEKESRLRSAERNKKEILKAKDTELRQKRQIEIQKDLNAALIGAVAVQLSYSPLPKKGGGGQGEGSNSGTASGEN